MELIYRKMSFSTVHFEIVVSILFCLCRPNVSWTFRKNFSNQGEWRDFDYSLPYAESAPDQDLSYENSYGIPNETYLLGSETALSTVDLNDLYQELEAKSKRMNSRTGSVENETFRTTNPYLKSNSGASVNELKTSRSSDGVAVEDSPKTYFLPVLRAANGSASNDAAREDRSRSKDCPLNLSITDVQWRKENKMVLIHFPYTGQRSCDPSKNCSDFKSIEQHISTQEGDSLKVMVQETPSETSILSTPGTLEKSSPSQPQDSLDKRSKVVKDGGGSLFSSDEMTEEMTEEMERSLTNFPLSSLYFRTLNLGSRVRRKKRQLDPSRTKAVYSRRSRRGSYIHSQKSSPPYAKLPSSNSSSFGSTGKGSSEGGGMAAALGQEVSLKVWEVTEKEWKSCRMRKEEVPKISLEGKIFIDQYSLTIGIHYFIGRTPKVKSGCLKLKVTVRGSNCGEGDLCSGKGFCVADSAKTEYTCKCCPGYTGSHCEEKDACEKNECQNAGICVDIEEGHDGDTFQCLCPYGFRGKVCENEASLCESNPCKNGGTCQGNHTIFECLCEEGWTGPHCLNRAVVVPPPKTSTPSFDTSSEVESLISADLEENDLSEGCASGYCVHGICVQTTAHESQCFCQPGFGGDKCEMEYDECASDPCANGATCVDHIGTYQCLCAPGYTGPNCLTMMCVPNPCTNGGTCYNVAESLSFYCACRPGFTGRVCQDASILESVGPYGTMEPPRDTESNRKSLPEPISHLRNLYTGAVTFACAFLIFLIVVSVCHCKMNVRNEGFPFFSKFALCRIGSVFKSSSQSFAKKKKKERRARSPSIHREDPEGPSTMMTSHSNSDSSFFNMDVSDNLELPLIE